MEIRLFSDINVNDPFFDSLKNDYKEFMKWFNKKADSTAYVGYDEEGNIQGFLYLKVEEGGITDVKPDLPVSRWLKVGTFKVNPHGTRLGERFVKKILDHATIENVDNVYVTVFPKHESLVRLLKKYGFNKAAEKETPNGIEDVLVKNMRIFRNNFLFDYPLINTQENKKYLLSIHPKFHTQLFPDSKLFNETYDLIKDVSHTNSIHKVYICYMEGVKALRPGDLLIVYRTSDGQGSAWYRSVATSICTVEEIKSRNSFAGIEEYITYCQTHSVFGRDELISWYNEKKPLLIIKMTYNIALTKRLNRKTLIQDIQLNSDYWGFFRINDQQLAQILEKGQVNESIIIN
ncbi:N-acetyltransferase [Pseudoflavitalea rhizosphaerae]|uniref:N-acetyltransferase n=1 Tax=Pseudoflavitalea rhizosphaerae TaxID=1884793 RepID=UPI000F8CCFBF|nr:N-acetyltransferase [Pseudoflavitalea rhizosphaerae]